MGGDALISLGNPKLVRFAVLPKWRDVGVRMDTHARAFNPVGKKLGWTDGFAEGWGAGGSWI
jgi:hypothetical protein